jgi:hypothetical protein
MTLTAEDLDGMISAARTRATGNWRTPGPTLHVLIAGDERPLTEGAVEMYLGFHAWLWGREPTPEERAQVLARLRQVPVSAEWSLRDAVRTVCALWVQIQERSEEDRATLREVLRQDREPGHFPELEAPMELGGAAGAFTGATDALTGKLMDDAGRAIRGQPPGPPQFF